MTQVINLFGGSGLGKSTTASDLFKEMKYQGLHVELVSEFAKELAWEGYKIGKFDQLWITGQQSKKESRLYGKVDYIVTDSPLLLSPIYELFYNKHSVVLSSVLEFLKLASQDKIMHINFILKRNKIFDPRGRYETEDTAKKVDEFVNQKLQEWNMFSTTVECPDRDRVSLILESIK